MITQAIMRLMDLTPDFHGVWPCNRIPELRENSSFIINTDPENKPGEHWVAIFIEGKKLFFFDSFGRRIDEFSNPFKSIMNQYSKDYTVVVESKYLQNIFSDTCGYWTIYYIFCKICRVEKAFDHFTKNTLLNETILDEQLEYLDIKNS